jgi:hypothetical protein
MQRFFSGLRLGSVVLAQILLVSGLAAAQDPPPPVGPASPPPPPPKYEDYGTQDDSPVDWVVLPDYEEKSGFFFRFQGGFAYNASWQEVNRKDQNLVGAGFGLGVSLGGFVANNLALGGEYTANFIPSPSFKLDGKDLGNDKSISLSSMYFSVNYYFTPIDIFIQAGAGLGWEWEPDGPGVGPALKFSAGKEFAVGNNWGIGFAAYTEYANLPNGSDANGSVRFNALTFGVAFTVSKW